MSRTTPPPPRYEDIVRSTVPTSATLDELIEELLQEHKPEEVPAPRTSLPLPGTRDDLVNAKEGDPPHAR